MNSSRASRSAGDISDFRQTAQNVVASPDLLEETMHKVVIDARLIVLVVREGCNVLPIHIDEKGALEVSSLDADIAIVVN